MAVRQQHNRYRTEPHGYDYDEVLKKGKVFYRASGEFEMSPYKSPYDDRVMWTAFPKTIGFAVADGTRRYKFNTITKKWEEVEI